MRVTLVGVKRSEYKKDGVMKSSYNYYGTKDFTRYDQESAECDGKCVVSEWSSVDFNVFPGDVVDFIYEPGYQDKATLVDIQLIAPARSNPYTEKKDDTPDKAADPKDKKAGA